MDEDQKIIKAVTDGDFELYSLLIRKYNREVMKVVAAMLFSYQDAEELVQKIFIEAYDKLDRFDSSRDFGKWIKGIARNTVKMYFRSCSTSARHIKVYQEWAVTQLDSDEDFELIDSKSDALKSCYQLVSDSNKEIIDLKYQKRLSIQNIADSLGRSLDGITKALSRTRAELRSCIRRKLSNE